MRNMTSCNINTVRAQAGRFSYAYYYFYIHGKKE